MSQFPTAISCCFQKLFGRSSNGKTVDSGSTYRGSNPCLPAKKIKDLRFVKRLVSPLFFSLGNSWETEIFISLYYQEIRSLVIAIKLLDLVPPDRIHSTIMSSSNLIVRGPSLTKGIARSLASLYTD